MKLKINGKKFDFFNDLKLNLIYASVGSTFAFKAFFDPENTEQRAIYKPYTYPIVEILDDDNVRLLRGRVINNGFTDSAIKSLVSFSGYSLPGVLEDCTIPPSLYPLQSDGKSLKEIAQALIEPFGLNLVISGSVKSLADEVFEKTVASQNQTIKSYLDELASQKNIVISHTDAGSLLFTRARANARPIAQFLGGIPEVKMTLSTNGRRMHNQITVQKQADIDNDNAGEETVNNPFVSIFRPTTKEQTSGDDIDTALAGKKALSAELKSIILTIEVDRWTWNDDGETMMKPNNIITVHNHDLYLYQFVKFFVESIAFSETKDKRTAVLTCVLPEVYNGQSPRNIFTIPNPHD